MEYSRIKYSSENKVSIISLNWPDKQNAVDDKMISELIHSFTQAQRDTNVKAVILRGEGDSFSSGVETTYLQKISKYDFNQNLLDSTDLMKLFQQIYTLRKPVIALVQGEAFYNGCGLISVCDYVIAAHETSKFGFLESKNGFIPAISLLFLVRKIGEGKARELVLTGRIINSEEALKIGLINQVVPAIELDSLGKKFVEELISDNSSTSIGLIKELLSRVHGMATSDALEYASHLNALNRMTDDCKKGIESLLNQKSVKW